MILAVGSHVDLERYSDSLDAERYYHLSRAAFTEISSLEDTTIETVMTLVRNLLIPSFQLKRLNLTQKSVLYVMVFSSLFEEGKSQCNCMGAIGPYRLVVQSLTSAWNESNSNTVKLAQNVSQALKLAFPHSIYRRPYRLGFVCAGQILPILV